MEEIVFEVHHGGYFVSIPRLHYRMGKKELFPLDIDKLGYMEIKSIIEDGLNYKNVTKIHWCVAGSSLDTLRLVVDDNSTMDMMNVSKEVICLYLEHEYDYTSAHDVLDLAGSSQPFGEDSFLGESSQALGED
ncbi:hypothetical protein FRX31_006319 [Thalictrum thalictroides]|uniref:PB1-like domain-containing protein n=1 Tax=Thalictrum thalictroides TaxID=46969 RepID=A0A7J6X346_THATH|nr:hypothetical protein FRX31_006319 [Thalictrum thalictroides]